MLRSSLKRKFLIKLLSKRKRMRYACYQHLMINRVLLRIKQTKVIKTKLILIMTSLIMVFNILTPLGSWTKKPIKPITTPQLTTVLQELTYNSNYQILILITSSQDLSSIILRILLKCSSNHHLLVITFRLEYHHNDLILVHQAGTKLFITFRQLIKLERPKSYILLLDSKVVVVS
jgi:hypothetical protein